MDAGFLQNRNLSNNRNLNKFIDENIQPDETFLSQCGAVIDRIYGHLRLEFQHGGQYSVNRMIKGGSLGKGTAVRGESDVDVVLFLNGFDSLQRFKEDLPNLLCKLEGFMRNVGQQNVGQRFVSAGIVGSSFGRQQDVGQRIVGSSFGRQQDVGQQNVGHCEVELKGRTQRAVKFTLKCDSKSPKIEVDLLPSFVIGNEDSIYDELKRLRPEQRNDPVLTEKQVEFVKRYGPSVKRLIRLVKYWRKREVTEGSNYPSSYPFELLTIHAWEEAGRPESFNTVQGFRQVLEYLVEYNKIRVMWTRASLVDQSLLRDSGPIIIDPANPTLNVCKCWSTWREVANRANVALQSPMLSDVQVNPGWR